MTIHRLVVREGDAGYQRCTACIMDTTDPEIRFDSQGRCNHCLSVETHLKSWDPAGNPDALARLADRIRRDGKGRDYDVACGLSGGVDSSYLALQSKKLGLRTLLIHVDTGWNSELAVQNIENMVSRLDCDLLTHVIKWEEMQDLQNAFFRSGVPNQDIPQDHAITAAFYNLAAKHGIKWVLSGSNFACECILPQAWGYDNLDLAHIRDIHRRFGRRPLREYPTMSYLDHGLRHQVLARMKVARPLNLLPYNKAEAIATLGREFDWRYYGGKHYESRFTKFFQGWYLPTKWGYDKRLAHLSSLIVTNQISRARALDEFAKGALAAEVIAGEKDYMARKLGATNAEFEELMNVPPRPHAQYKQTPSWLRRGMRGAVRAARVVFDGKLKTR